MNLLLNRQKVNKKYNNRKEVKKMKRLCALTMVLFFLAGTSIVVAEPHSELVERSTKVHTEFNAFGIAISSTSIHTEVLDVTDDEGNVTTTRTVTTTEASYKNGSLKPDTSHTISTTINSEGQMLSKSEYTDTYVYDDAGHLISASGTGTFEAWNAEGVLSRSGTITRTFEIRDGQALMQSSVTTGDIFDKDGEVIGTFTNTTTYDEYQYLGGSWVLMNSTSTSASNMLDGSSETITRVTTYSRNEHGTITGIGQTATGRRVVVTGATGEGQISQFTDELVDFSVVVKFHPNLGWYIASEDYEWRNIDTITNPVNDDGGGDPVLYGEVVKVVIDGVEYIGIKADLIDILDGSGLQDAEGEVWLLFGDEATKLNDFIGKKVMAMGDVGRRVGGATDGYHVLRVRNDYGGGIGTDNVETRLGNYEQEAWYQTNLATMVTNIWHGIQRNWRAGVTLLLNLFGLA